MTARELPIGFLLYEGCDLLDLSGPAEVFKFAELHLKADGNGPRPAPKLHYFSPDGGLVTTAQGLPVLTQPIADIPDRKLDTMVVVGSLDVHLSCDPRLPACMAECSGSLRRVAAICSGAFVLAEAGLLDGRRAVTHWSDCDTLGRRFPAIEVDPGCIFVEDGDVWTSAGVTAGIDMALAMVEQDYGPECAMDVARRMVVFLKRPAGQSQVSMELLAQGSTGPIGDLLKWIARHPDGDLRAETLADRVNMSLRNFYRAFEEATRSSPAEWVEATRLEVAKRLLEQTNEYAEQVAVKSGFVTYERMRRTFVRRLGVSPLAYRGRQSHAAEAPTPEIYLQAGNRADERPVANPLRA